MNRWFIRVGFLFHSNWSHFIAPYRSMLVRSIPGISIRFRCGAAIGNLQSNASGCSVASSGRTMQSSGTVSSQQTISTGTGSTVLQPSVTVQRFATDLYLRCSLSYWEVEETTFQCVYRFDIHTASQYDVYARSCCDLDPIRQVVIRNGSRADKRLF